MDKKYRWIELKDLCPRELAQYVTWKDVKESLRFHYGKAYKWNGGESILERIKNAPKKRSKSGQFLEIYAANTVYPNDRDMDESNYGIHLIEPKNIDPMTKEPKVWGMSFVNWDRLINTKFLQGMFRHYTSTDLMAHFIWELTWYGNESDTKKKGKEIFSDARKAMKDIKAGKYT